MRFIATMLFVLLPLCAQDAPPQKKGGGGGAPKNLKVLTPDELRAGVMQTFTKALGQNCTFCHVQDRSSDENPKKDVARTMIAMVKDLNTKLNGTADKPAVTCYTCHRGKTEPETVAPAQ